MSPDVRALGRHVAERQDADLDVFSPDEALRERLAARAASRLEVTPARVRPAWLWGGAAVACAVSVLAVVALRSPARADRTPLSFGVGDQPGQLHAWVSAPADADLPLRFSDGSTVVLERGARGRVVGATADGAEVVVEQGAAHANVVHRDGSSWRVRSGPFVVHVTGTRFSVNWDAPRDTVTVRLEEGSVRVSGCSLGEGQALVAGQQLQASCRTGRTAVGALSDDRGEPAEAVESPVAPAPHATPKDEVAPAAAPGAPVAPTNRRFMAARAAVAERPTWQTLARDGRYAEGLAAVTTAGLSAEMARASASDLLLLGDTVRLGGRGADAPEVYRAVRERYGGSSQAARAAFHLGRLGSTSGRRADAIRWYETYLVEQPGGPFAAAALGRLMEEHARAGDAARARNAASRYLATYPNGSHADDARKILQGVR